MKPKIAVHKFSSCDGCQLAFLNAGEDLITLSTLVDIT
ncbi:MAG: sulfhydrogenase subunit delta, partial [Gammaproteobacteria bacterium]|nr:sulfhydrogenase subunit delta [Gammaproteobacteria bacterium]